MNTDTDLLKAEYFEETREVFLYKFEKVISEYILNTQPRPIKSAIVDGIPGSTTEGPLLKPNSDTHKQAFHKECGDKFLDGVGMGARLYVIAHYDTKNYSNYEKSTIKSTVGAAIEEILTIGDDTTHTEELVEILNSYNVKFDVVPFGGPETPISYDKLTDIAEEIYNFELGITESNAVAITESFREYTLPEKYNNLNHYQVFADISDILYNARKYSAVMNEYGARCATLSNYNDIIGSNFNSSECDSKNLLIDLERARDYCSIQSSWYRCQHPVHITTPSGHNLVNLLGEKVKAFEDSTVISPTYKDSVSKSGFKKKCRESQEYTCLPTACYEDIKEGGRFGTGQGFDIDPWSYKSPATKSPTGYHSFNVVTLNGQRCVKSNVKVCTKAVGPSNAHYSYQTRLEGVCAIDREFPIN